MIVVFFLSVTCTEFLLGDHQDLEQKLNKKSNRAIFSHIIPQILKLEELGWHTLCQRLRYEA
jgi:hypothetical protein